MLVQHPDWDKLPPILTANEASEVLRVGYRVIIALCKQKGFPASRIGKKWLINRDGLREWAAKNLIA